MTIEEILTEVKNGEVSVSQAEAMLKQKYYNTVSGHETIQMMNGRRQGFTEDDLAELNNSETDQCMVNTVSTGNYGTNSACMGDAKMGYNEMGYAKLDSDRKQRTGFAEVVFCSGKTVEQLRSIYQHILDGEGEVLGTRASKEQYEVLKQTFPDISYDELSHILKIEKQNKPHYGNVAVCSAGTADIPVAEEAAQTAEFFGTKVNRIYDVGVSGIHRLLSKTDELRNANCVVAVAGMEGALPSVLGGIVKNPVIAVPTSVGYGASFQGLSALLTMINSCANGIAVVNIDNGYGAGYLATQMNRMALGENNM